MIPCKTKLVKAKGIESVYLGHRTGRRLDVKHFGEGAYIRPKMFERLKELKKAVEARGGNFFIIDLFRSWEQQERARADYESGLKKDFVARPGRSFHNAGTAVDIDVRNLNFPDIPQPAWLKEFWQIALAHSLFPIIKIPDLGMSECWHFDFIEPEWEYAYFAGEYEQVAKAMILDVGKWDTDFAEETVKRMFVQSQLYRLGHVDIGRIDGDIGPKTIRALNREDISAGYDDVDFLVQTLINL